MRGEFIRVVSMVRTYLRPQMDPTKWATPGLTSHTANCRLRPIISPRTTFSARVGLAVCIKERCRTGQLWPWSSWTWAEVRASGSFEPKLRSSAGCIIAIWSRSLGTACRINSAYLCTSSCPMVHWRITCTVSARSALKSHSFFSVIFLEALYHIVENIAAFCPAIWLLV